jgi:hypothetical protein
MMIRTPSPTILARVSMTGTSPQYPAICLSAKMAGFSHVPLFPTVANQKHDRPGRSQANQPEAGDQLLAGEVRCTATSASRAARNVTSQSLCLVHVLLAPLILSSWWTPEFKLQPLVTAMERPGNRK